MNQTQIIRFTIGQAGQVEALKEYNRLRREGYKGAYDVNQQTGEVTITLTAPQVEKAGK